jgi:hypothetical protein
METIRKVDESIAMSAIRAERRRQIDVEGWSAAHDDAHYTGDLLRAAGCYFAHGTFDMKTRQFLSDGTPVGWPWDEGWWKPKDPRRDLERAGALCLAEIDHLRRQIVEIECGLLRKIEAELAILMGPDLLKSAGDDRDSAP